MRIDKYLSDMGIGSRKEIKDLLKKGHVSFNGELIKDPGYQIDENKEVIVDGRKIKYEACQYYMLNKPKGVLSTSFDKKRRTVIDLIDSENKRKDLFPVGRLDLDTEGLIIITNDGDLCHRLLSPERHVDKTYRVLMEGSLSEEDERLLREGIYYDNDHKSLPAGVKVLERKTSETELLLIIHEGKFHEIRKMIMALGDGKCVLELERISMGGIDLDKNLKKGEARPLTEDEIRLLREASKNINHS